VALIGDLENLSDAQWSMQSLCSAWTVRDVLAHMTTTAKMTPGRFFGRFAGTGFQFNAMNQKGVKEELGATPADTLSGFKAQLDRTTAPPGPLDAMVGEVVIHGQDIRRPLGIERVIPVDHLTAALDAMPRIGGFLKSKRVAKGLRLVATDVDHTVGDGPEVRGPAEAIVLALSGRPVGLPELQGAGVATLRDRIAG
jgi:uncharacterized protein (TIGR03083 family)